MLVMAMKLNGLTRLRSSEFWKRGPRFSAKLCQIKRRVPLLGRPSFQMPPVISIVDDDASVRAATDNLLSSRGYVVYAFASADDFLRSDRLQDSSCVVSDVQMPAMSGLDLLAHMRTQGNKTPFILITAFLDESVRAQALRAGAIGLLAKPYGGSDLISCIEAALDSHDRKIGK